MKKAFFLVIIALFILTACNTIPQKPEIIELNQGETVISAGVRGENIYYLTTDTTGTKKLYYKYPNQTKEYIFVEK